MSTQIPNNAALRAAESLLRGCGGTTAYLQVPPLTGDTSDAAQMGINAPNFQLLALAPAVLKQARPLATEGQQQRYEVTIAGAAVAAQVSALNLSSAAALFALASGVVVAGKLFAIEAVTTRESQGQAYLYQLALRDAAGEWTMQG